MPDVGGGMRGGGEGDRGEEGGSESSVRGSSLDRRRFLQCRRRETQGLGEVSEGETGRAMERGGDECGGTYGRDWV